MSCKSCSDVTLLSGSDGNGVQTVVDNGNGTFTFFFTDGSTFTTPNFTGSPGAAATIGLASPPALVGAPGTAPTVTNTGSSSAAVFQFTFPIGIGHDNTLFVDLVFGATAGVRERIDKPWNTISAAITAATAGDTVHIRPGVYGTASSPITITLKDGVDIYCEEGVHINGYVTDAGAKVVSNISGYAILQDDETSTTCINITGNQTNVKFKFKDIINEGTCILQRAATGQTNTMLLETDTISGNTTNYFITLGGNVHNTTRVNKSAETAASSTDPFRGVDIREGGGSAVFSGTLNFSCPKIIIGNSSDIAAGCALSVEATTTADAKVFFNVDEIINNYDQPINTQSKTVGTLTLNGNGKYLVNVKDCYSKSRVGLIIGAGDIFGSGSGTPKTGTTIFEGNIFSLRSAAVRVLGVNNANNDTRLIVRNSSLMRGIDPDNSSVEALKDRNTVVIFGDAGYGTPQVSGTDIDAFNYLKAEFINTQIIKRTNTGNADDYRSTLVALQGENSLIYFKDVDFVGGILYPSVGAVNAHIMAGFNGSSLATPVAGTEAPANGKVYFKNAHMNINLTWPGLTGTNSTAGVTLTDATKNFPSDGARVGDIVRENSSNIDRKVTAVAPGGDNTKLTLDGSVTGAYTLRGGGKVGVQLSPVNSGIGVLLTNSATGNGYLKQTNIATYNYLHIA